MSAAHDVQALLAQLTRLEPGRKLRLAPSDGNCDVEARALVLGLAWPGLSDVLPDGGLPRGVVELTAPRALGGATSLALAAVRAGQARGSRTWCTWVDPEATLHAPGLVAAGVDLTRLLVVRPPRSQLGRVAVKLLGAGAFEVVVIDMDAIPGAVAWGPTTVASSATQAGRRRGWSPEVLVRKLALAAEASGATVLLLTDSTRRRSVPWPVTLRLELARPTRSELAIRVGKDRRGRIGTAARTIPFRPCAVASG